jgi:hypothetical protein
MVHKVLLFGINKFRQIVGSGANGMPGSMILIRRVIFIAKELLKLPCFVV